MKKVINSSWTVTIVGTTLGVLIAFFLSNWREDYKESKRVQTVLEQIKFEIQQNKENLEESLDSTEFILPYYHLLKHINNDTLFLSIQEKKEYIDEFGDSTVLFVDSSLYEGDYYSYEFKFVNRIKLNFNPVKTGDVSWRLAQNLGVIQSMPFELLKHLEAIYGVQIVLKNREDVLLDYLGESIDSFDILKKIFNEIYQNRNVQQQLIQEYALVLEKI